MTIAGAICLGLAVPCLVQAYREAKRHRDWQHAEWTAATAVLIIAAFVLLILF